MVSQRHSGLENKVAQRGMQSGFGDDVDLSAEQLLGVHQKAAEREPAAAGRQNHEQIDVAVVAAVATRHRAEDAHAFYATASGEREQLGAVSFDQRMHGVFSFRRKAGFTTLEPFPEGGRPAVPVVAPDFPRYWNATSANPRSLRLCSRPALWSRSSSSARMPMRRCWSTRSR